MAFTHRIGVSYASADGSIAGVTTTVTGDGEGGYDGTVLKSTTNMEIDLAVDVSQIVALCLYSSKAVTIKTNSTGAPADTIELAAGVPLIWYSTQAGGGSCPLTVDVTKFYITNASGTNDAVVKLRWLLDSTP